MIIWAIDPNETNPKNLNKVARILKLLDPNEKEIQPVSVLSPLDFGWPMEITKRLKDELFQRANEKAAQLFQKIELSKKAPEILISPKLSMLSAVKKLSLFAKSEGAEMLVFFSKAGDQKKRTGLGSFTELAIGSSKVPVMVVSEKTKVPKRVSSFLLPTDFSEVRDEAFEKALEWAKDAGAELILYHQLGTPLAPITYTSFGAPMEAAWIQDAWDIAKEQDEKKAQAWLEKARKKGVSCRLISEVSPATWSERILQIMQKQKADFLIVPVRRGVWGQTLFGGKIRKLIAESPIPLILIHSD